jgi:hypothetical protein
LQRAAALWFVTAVAGQWVFVYYISAFYGPATASGDWAAWDRNKHMTDGYVAGDDAGNVFFAAHVICAAAVTFAGTLQLIPWIRERAIAFHRWNGRTFMIAALAGALGGLYLEWVRGTGMRAPTGLASAFGVTLNAVLILWFVVVAWLTARNRNVSVHHLGDAPVPGRERHVVHACRRTRLVRADRRHVRRISFLQLLVVRGLSPAARGLRAVSAREVIESGRAACDGDGSGRADSADGNRGGIDVPAELAPASGAVITIPRT